MKKIPFLLLGLIISIQAYSQCITNYQSAIKDNNNCKYILPTSSINNWQTTSFNDSLWNNGVTGIGYGDNDDNTTVASGTTCVYTRIHFTITDTAQIANAIFNMDYDDGYIAYLNGVEIAKSTNINLPINFNTLATSSHEAQLYQSQLPETTELNEALLKTIILPGDNVLAVAIFNESNGSSDLTGRPFLHFNIKNSTQYFSANPNWFQATSNGHATQLPIIDIQTNGQLIDDNIRIVADMRIIDSTSVGYNCIFSNENYFKGKITIEYRGSTSQFFPKMPYGFTTIDQAGLDSNVKWWHYAAESDWVLLNTYNDKTFMRDKMAYDLSKKMGWYASKTKHVVVYVNDEYMGIYLLLEKVKRDNGRVNIQKTDSFSTDVTGGYIWKLDKITGNSGPIFTTTNQGLGFQNHYPSYDKITATQQQYLTNYTNKFEQSLFNNNFINADTGYRKYANVFSFIDEHLLLELSNNIDGCGDGTSKYTLKMLSDPWFKNMTKCRWQNLRQGILHKDSLFDYITTTTNYLKAEVVYDSTKWQTIGNYVWPNGWIANTWQGEIDSMKFWISKRLNWMDSVFNLNGNACNQINKNGIVIDEINYTIVGANTSNDWIEIWNSSTSTIDISNYILADKYSKQKYCVVPSNTVLLANERLVIYKDSLAFFNLHGNVGKTVGPLCFDLPKEGMAIELFDAFNRTVTAFHYQSIAPWPIDPIYASTTLQLINPSLDASLASSWKNGCEKGTPGLPQNINCWPLKNTNYLNNTLLIYPNPVNNFVRLQGLNQIENYKVFIHNIYGVKVLESNFQEVINVQSLKNGLYTLTIFDKENRKIAVDKFVKIDK